LDLEEDPTAYDPDVLVLNRMNEPSPVHRRQVFGLTMFPNPPTVEPSDVHLRVIPQEPGIPESFGDEGAILQPEAAWFGRPKVRSVSHLVCLCLALLMPTCYARLKWAPLMPNPLGLALLAHTALS
jgi:hypothetical protein